MELVLATATGAAIGGLVTWLYLRSRSAAVEARLEDRDKSLAKELETSDILNRELTETRERLAGEKTAHTKDTEAAKERFEDLRKTQDELLEQYAAASLKALNSNSESFLKLAKTQINKMIAEVEAREKMQKKEMEKLVDPLKESLKGVDEQLEKLEKKRIEAYSALTEQVKGLSAAQLQIQKETANLVTALRKPTVRGRWGEFHLRRVVELAGLVEHCDFEEQQSVDTDDGKLRPDLVVRLAGGRNIVVDAKTPLDAYLNAIEAEDPDVKNDFLKKHVKQVREHVRQLAAKAYHDQFILAPDIVVLFLPSESILYEASHADPTLLEFGIENRVLIATPMTLIALLHGVATGWRQDTIAKNAQQISKLGQDLYERICKYAEHFSKVGSRLNSVVTSYNQAVGTLESRVLVSARRFKELGSASTQDIPQLEQIDTSPREIQSPELKRIGSEIPAGNSSISEADAVNENESGIV